MLQFLLGNGVTFDTRDLQWAYNTDQSRTSRNCDGWNYLMKGYYNVVHGFPSLDLAAASLSNYTRLHWGLLDHALAYGNIEYLKRLFASDDHDLDVRLCQFKLTAFTSKHDIALQDWTADVRRTLADALRPWRLNRTQWYNATYNAKAEQARRAMIVRGLEVEDCHDIVFSYISRLEKKEVLSKPHAAGAWP